MKPSSLTLAFFATASITSSLLFACGSSTTKESTGTGATSTSSSTNTTSASASSSTNTSSSNTTSSSGSTSSSTSTSGSSGSSSSGFPGDAGPTTTIAAARMANVGTAITVAAVVTAVQGPSGDEVNYYIEDPAGGPYSGVGVYCDPLETKCPAEPRAGNPSVGDYVLITGTMSTYKGQLQLEPTNYTKISAGHAIPPPVSVQGSDVAAAGTSAQYRGVLVKLAETLTVTNLTPEALYNTTCGTPTADGGPLCSGCTPPTYSGFQATDSTNDVIYVEQYLFPGDPLQSSPECLDAGGQVAVTNGETFPFMEGILDFDPYASAQFLAPRGPSDY